VSHATEKLDIREMGDLARRMPLTALCFGLGAAALGGLPPLSGFFSKDEVLRALLEGRHPLFFALALAVSFLSALAMARAFFVVFLGRPKPENAHAHESPALMLGPMLLFAFFALTVGFLALGYTGAYRGLGTFLFLGEKEPFHFNGGLAALSTVVAAAGFAVGWLAYVGGQISPARLIARFPAVHRLWARKYYLDDAYQWAIDRVVLAFGRLVALFDRRVVNDLGVNGTGESVAGSGRGLRYHATGKLYNYALGMTLGVLALARLWWLAAR
jgi:NADH-quinone oxidoreductase subunit L